MKIKKALFRATACIFTAILTLCATGCSLTELYRSYSTNPPSQIEEKPSATLDDIPAFSGDPYVTIHDNIPEFSENDRTTTSFETYSKLDSLKRCGAAYACIGTDLMPTGERRPIGQVRPSGWHSVRYDFIDGKSLYNRCHLIGYQLTAENANDKNLITGTRYLNVEGMLPFENKVANYIRETKNHVLYRVTPIFEGNNLVASGVHMEALSVEDNGEGIQFNVYCYNAQPGVSIDYASGDSKPDGSMGAASAPDDEDDEKQPANKKITYVLNTNGKKFHLPSCPSVKMIKDKNKKEFTGTRDEAAAMGYEPCGSCRP